MTQETSKQDIDTCAKSIDGLRKALTRVLDVYTDYFNSVADGKPNDITVSDEDRELALKFIEKMPKLQALAKKETNHIPTEDDDSEVQTPTETQKPVGNYFEALSEKVKGKINGKTTVGSTEV